MLGQSHHPLPPLMGLRRGKRQVNEAKGRQRLSSGFYFTCQTLSVIVDVKQAMQSLFSMFEWCVESFNGLDSCQLG